ncbi:acyl-CoA thioesterase [Ruegeria aquimaris]|uniref:Acyl-CoA thioesterase n=1 Tax=Ruegeria aquimaris TaxID=2984333 RepID=A0ABT3APK7_9RHOB|nr:acyl-CoA thioesterase [Ruegeria sp. XHP0148]MCV2890620.1 acyl-CoA thioesterase [Ruegeria sp. XHP0148]
MSDFVSFRSVVDPSDCDFLGHMNVSRYFAACSDAVVAVQSEMGLTASDMRGGRRLSFAVVHADSNFLAELAAGDAIYMRTSVVEFGGKSLTFRHRLFRAADGKEAFHTLFKCVLLNLETRRAETLPEEVRSKALEWVEEGFTGMPGV